jgi:hypothetical protein
VEIVSGDPHPFHRYAAVVQDQKVEGPVICGDGLKRLRVLLPFQPLRSGPPARMRHLPAVGASGGNQHQPLRLPVRRRRQEDASDQAENRRGRADTERQRNHGNQSKAGLFAQHAQANSQILKHLAVLRYFPLTNRIQAALAALSRKFRFRPNLAYTQTSVYYEV